MKRTHVSFKVSNLMKAWMGERAPKPMHKMAYCGMNVRDKKNRDPYPGRCSLLWVERGDVWSYQLHDILSPTLCAEMAAVWCFKNPKPMGRSAHGTAIRFCDAYFRAGIKGLEKELMAFMAIDKRKD